MASTKMSHPIQDEERLSREAEDYRYTDVKWKDYITKPKYIRELNSGIGVESTSTNRSSFVDFDNCRYGAFHSANYTARSNC